MRVFVAALALVVGAAACSGPLRVSGPGVVVETEPAELPPNPDVAEVSGTVPRGMGLAITSEPPDDPEEDEAGSGEGPPGEAEAPISPGSESPPSPAEEPPFAERIAEKLVDAMLERLPEPVDVLALIQALTGGPAPVPEEPEPEPIAEAAPAPEYTAETEELREFMGRGKGGWSPEEEAAAVAKAEEVLGFGLAAFEAPRRDAWIAACHVMACETLTVPRRASLEGDWELAAGEFDLAMVPHFGSQRAAVLGHWLLTGERLEE